MTSKTIPTEEERLSDDELKSWVRSTQNDVAEGIREAPVFTPKLLSFLLELQSLRSQPTREAVIEVLRAYEQLEADVIMEPACWFGGLPRITRPLWDRFIEIQAMRNAALSDTGE